MLKTIAVSDEEPVAAGMLLFQDFGMGEFDARHQIGPALWPHFDLLAIHSGRVELELMRRDRIELSAGQAVLIYPHTYFSGRSLVKMSRASVQHFLPINTAAPGYPWILAELHGRRDGFEIHRRLRRGVYRDVQRAMRLAWRPASPAVHAMREAVMILILCQLSEGTSSPGRSSAKEEPFDFEPLTRWMAAHLDRPISLEEMARITGLSTSYFRALFTRQMGYPPSRFLRRLAHIEASRLLRETGLPIKVISRRLGYDDLSHFYRFFAAFTSVTPMEYRRRHRVKG